MTFDGALQVSLKRDRVLRKMEVGRAKSESSLGAYLPSFSDPLHLSPLFPCAIAIDVFSNQYIKNRNIGI